MNETPLYATLLYDVRKQLDISIAEYFFLDMVYHLSYDRWCSKSIQNCAEDMGMQKRGMIYMRDRLIERGLLKKNKQGFLKVTRKYTEVAVQKVHPSVQKVHRGGAKSAPKNNNRNTENIGIFKKGRKNASTAAVTPCDYTAACKCQDCTYKRTMRAISGRSDVLAKRKRPTGHSEHKNVSEGPNLRPGGHSDAALPLVVLSADVDVGVVTPASG